jgi:hypothetical protein
VKLRPDRRTQGSTWILRIAIIVVLVSAVLAAGVFWHGWPTGSRAARGGAAATQLGEAP